MSFLSHLEQVVSQVQGALACSVMGLDGIAVETHETPAASELELAGAWVEYLGPVKQLKEAAELLKTGAVQEICVSSEKVITLMRMVSADYFLVLALKPDGNYGRGRYALRITAPMVKAEL